jgi:putative spermidine/putrescine transport system permease protein
MAAVSPNAGGPIMLDGVPLKIRLERAERMRKIKAMGLILPLFIFLMVTFAIPIVVMLMRSVENPEIVQVLPRTAAAMRLWDGEGFPPNEAMQTFAAEVVTAKAAKTLGKAAKRLNYNASGFRSMLFKTGTKLERAIKKEGEEAVLQGPEMLERFIDIDKRWGERRYWSIIRQSSPPHTAWYLLRSIDRDYDENADIIPISEDQAIHVEVLWRTIVISAVVTVLCLLLGFPIAYLLGTLPTKQSNLLILLLLLPFWTSLLVRTTAWLVLLQNEGVINDIAIYFGLWEEPVQLVRNRMGTYIAMVHILLPFMVLPMFSVMKGIDPYHMKAAASLGANPVSAFIKVYLPQTLPGVGAGVLLVFILSLGYYITPALVGGPADQMLSYFIAFHVNTTVNWGLASALSALLLVCVMIFFAMYQRLVGVGNIRMN